MWRVVRCVRLHIFFRLITIWHQSPKTISFVNSFCPEHVYRVTRSYDVQYTFEVSPLRTEATDVEINWKYTRCPILIDPPNHLQNYSLCFKVEFILLWEKRSLTNVNFIHSETRPWFPRWSLFLRMKLRFRLIFFRDEFIKPRYIYLRRSFIAIRNLLSLNVLEIILISV